MIEGIDPQVRAAIDAAVKQLNSLGAEIVEVSLPSTEYAVAIYYIIATAEASANLARFDGVRYGYRAENPKDVLDLYGRTREEGFGPEVKRRIILGTYVLSSGYYDAYYLRAQKVRELIRRDFAKVFEKVDALISPTSPIAAFKLGERVADPLQMYLADIFTIAANLAGICGISVPCGFAELNGHRLPIGLQLLGKPLEKRAFCKSHTPTSRAQTGTKRVRQSRPACQKHQSSGVPFKSSTGAAVFDRLQEFRDGFGARFGAEIAFAVDADADGVGFHVALSNHEHGVDFHLLGSLDFAVDLVATFVDFRADLMSAQFVQNRSRVIE